MNAFVVDTNVAVVANGRSEQAGPRCESASVQALRTAISSVVCIDDSMLILSEYMNNLRMAGQPGVGDAFMKWVFQNQAVRERVEQVRITHSDGAPTSFEEFPTDHELNGFDPSDRKFVAVALASEHSPSVLNAVDSDWWHF
ncbi:MAG: hypothetical protein ISQ06_12720 [Planctomycetaceae bacterium]|nr:hypothetical protein [Planctomycetaceae bacterium]